MATQAAECLPAPLTEKADENSWKLCGLLALVPRGGQAELVTPRAEPVPGMEFPMLPTGKGMDSQPRLRVDLSSSQPESPFGELRIAWSCPSHTHPGKELRQPHSLWRVS